MYAQALMCPKTKCSSQSSRRASETGLVHGYLRITAAFTLNIPKQVFKPFNFCFPCLVCKHLILHTALIFSGVVVLTATEENTKKIRKDSLVKCRAAHSGHQNSLSIKEYKKEKKKGKRQKIVFATRMIFIKFNPKTHVFL